MSKVTVILDDGHGRQFNVEVEESIVREKDIVVYKKEYYQYVKWDGSWSGEHLYVKINQPAFIG